jgi:A/G-specific adenine glycosylase
VSRQDTQHRQPVKHPARTDAAATGLAPALGTRAAGALAARLVEWFSKQARDLPWRRTLDPYGIWVAEIMLQQTQVKTVIPYWTRWMKELPNLQSLAAARSEAVLKLWEGLGYYSRVRNLQKAAQDLVSNRNATVPRDLQAIDALPGVGRYTAGAIASIAFDLPAAILDGNVLRVLTRLLGIEGDPRERNVSRMLWGAAASLVAAAARLPKAKRALPPRPLRLAGPCSALNQSLMELGATICLPRQPRCTECPLRGRCVACRTGRTAEIPNLGPRPAATDRRFAAFLVQHRGRWLVRRRPAGVVNAHLWEFPNAELTPGAEPVAAASVLLGFTPASLRPFHTVRHSITRSRIVLEAHLASCRGRPRLRPGSWRWLTPAELEPLAWPSAHRQILTRMLASATTTT